jgi:AraC-like DNA-binding protein
MSIELTLPNGERLNFRTGLPNNYSGPILRGAFAVSIKTDLADISVQELAGEEYSIRLTIGRFFKRIAAAGNLKNNGLYSYFMLKGNLRKEIKTLDKFHLRQDHYVCFITEPTSCLAKFEKDVEYRVVDLFYSPLLLNELLPFFPELKEVLFGSTAVSLTQKTWWTVPSMKEIINQLINCPYNESTRQFYFDLKVRELLYQMLEHAYKRKPSENSFTPWEAAKIHEVKTILESYISKKPPSVRSLSKRVALNEYKLKRGFKQYFNAGMFEWLLEQKMQYARKLILTTNKPIKEICGMAGYPLTTNFITAFRRRFGVTPGALRRK